MVAVHVVHVAIVQIAIVVIMLNCLVSATFSMLMLMFAVNFTRHLTSPFSVFQSVIETKLFLAF